MLYNRGKTANKQIPGESDADYAKRVEDVKTIVGDRKDPEVRYSSLTGASVREVTWFSVPFVCVRCPSVCMNLGGVGRCKRGRQLAETLFLSVIFHQYFYFVDGSISLDVVPGGMPTFPRETMP